MVVVVGVGWVVVVVGEVGVVGWVVCLCVFFSGIVVVLFL